MSENANDEKETEESVRENLANRVYITMDKPRARTDAWKKFFLVVRAEGQ